MACSIPGTSGRLGRRRGKAESRRRNESPRQPRCIPVAPPVLSLIRPNYFADMPELFPCYAPVIFPVPSRRSFSKPRKTKAFLAVWEPTTAPFSLFSPCCCPLRRAEKPKIAGWRRCDRNPIAASPRPARSPRALSLRELKPHRPVARGIVEPVLAHLHMQEEVHHAAVDRSDVLAGGRADRLDRAPALADDDLAVALARHEHRLLDPRRAVRQVLPAVGLDGGLIGQFVVQALDELFARDFGGERTDRPFGDLVLRIEPRTDGNDRREPLGEPVEAVAVRGADHEGLVERA